MVITGLFNQGSTRFLFVCSFEAFQTKNKYEKERRRWSVLPTSLEKHFMEIDFINAET